MGRGREPNLLGGAGVLEKKRGILFFLAWQRHSHPLHLICEHLLWWSKDQRMLLAPVLALRFVYVPLMCQVLKTVWWQQLAAVPRLAITLPWVCPALIVGL